MRLDLNHLAVLEALVAERSVTGAARRLHMTPQAVGGALRRLREFTGDALLERDGRDMRPTGRALEIVKPVGAALERVRAVIRRSRGPAAGFSHGRVRMAMIDYASELLLPRIAQLLYEVEPNLELVATRVEATNLAVRLAAAENHLVITRPMPLPKSFRRELLLREGWKVLMREDHPAPPSLTLDDYCALAHAVQTHGHGAPPQTSIDAALARAGRKRDIALVATTAFPAVTPGQDFVATTPESVALHRALARKLRVSDPPLPLPPAELYLVWHRKREAEALHGVLRNIVARACELL